MKLGNSTVAAGGFIWQMFLGSQQKALNWKVTQYWTWVLDITCWAPSPKNLKFGKLKALRHPYESIDCDDLINALCNLMWRSLKMVLVPALVFSKDVGQSGAKYCKNFKKEITELPFTTLWWFWEISCQSDWQDVVRSVVPETMMLLEMSMYDSLGRRHAMTCLDDGIWTSLARVNSNQFPCTLASLCFT